jgi:hypothetical protein
MLPEGEREPVAFGIYLGGSAGWNAAEREHFRRRFLFGCESAALEVLGKADHGKFQAPVRVPATLEEFPSRIWKRALASGRPGRLAVAGAQALEAIIRLLESHPGPVDQIPERFLGHLRVNARVDLAEEDLGPRAIPKRRRIETSMSVSGRPHTPFELDLIALGPDAGHTLKARMLHHFTGRGFAGEFLTGRAIMRPLLLWFHCAIRDAVPEEPFRESREKLASRKGRWPIDSILDAESKILGPIAWRCGRRRSAAAFDPLPRPGLRRLHGWHHLPIQPLRHARIRKFLAERNGAETETWLTDPGLACSGMSLPLWMADGVCRIGDLCSLMERAGTFPWVFPRLYHVFQWHLALAGRGAELGAIAYRHPGDSWGLDTPTPDEILTLVTRPPAPQEAVAPDQTALTRAHRTQA